MAQMDISFRKLTQDDLPLMYKWLTTDFVHKWYSKETDWTMERIIEKYLPRIKGETYVKPYVMLVDGNEAGYIQTYLIDENPSYKDEIGVDDAAGVDLFIGERDYIHKGLGSKIIRAFIKDVVFEIFDVNNCVINPEPDNKSAIRAYEKAGLQYVRTVFIEESGEEEYVMVTHKSDNWIKKNKKTVILFIIILILISIGINFVDIEKKYSDMDEYILNRFGKSDINIIESNGYYLVVAQYSKNTFDRGILYYDEEGIVNEVETSTLFERNYKKRTFFLNLDSAYHSPQSIIEFNDVYIVLFNFYHSIMFGEEIGSPFDSYYVYDKYGKWEHLRVDYSDGDIYSIYFFGVVENLNDYCACLIADNKKYELISGEDIEYFFDDGTTQRDIHEYTSN